MFTHRLCSPYQKTPKKIFPENNFAIKVYVIEDKCFGDGTLQKNTAFSICFLTSWLYSFINKNSDSVPYR